MKINENIIKEKITSIEKRVAELKFIERDIVKEREIIRFPLLEKAEKSPRVEELINSFYIKTIKLNRSNITVTSYPSGYSGREGEEFLSEIKIEIRYRPEQPVDYTELSLEVYLCEGFENDIIRKKESDIMNRLLEVKEEIEKLREEKRGLRSAAE
ncbi:MAG TPA: hypothetical protein PKZ64_17940 [Spirochaetota bacterium]|nr:hypothetical protein [Spirochaetota bacterium]HPJ44214.1 hypothetical protein [Spirochaetota bacterium]